MSNEVILIPLAAGMVLATGLLIKTCAQSRTTPRAAGSVFLIGMMAAMLVGALIYFTSPSTSTLIDGLWASSVIMSLGVLPVFFQFLADARRQIASGGQYAASPFTPTVAYTLVVIGLVVVSEFLMGAVFQLASGTSFTGLTSGTYGGWSTVPNVVLSPWFIYTMSAEMALTVYLLRRELSRPFLAVLGLQTAIMALTPTTFSDVNTTDFLILFGSVVMIAFFVYEMEYIYRNKEFARPLANYVLRLFLIYGLMMTGLFVWLAYGDGTLFAVSILLEMILYFDTIVRGTRRTTDERLAWQLNARWTFGVLAAIFVSELFMGALLDQVILPSDWFSSFSFLALSGSGTDILYAAVYNGFTFVAAVTGSTWFLTMMGVEMGALVVFKFRETKSRETRIRLSLLLGSYAAFVVFFPSLYYSIVFPNAPDQLTVPLLGWSMGIGSGAIVPAVFGVIASTYVIMAVLSMAFGRRWVCSVFCSASLMYQGTTIDATKTFNRSSTIGHKYLGSRFSTAFSITMGIVMGSLVITSVVSYLDYTGALNVQIFGLDPTVFFFAFYFGILWYAMFVMIPYVGNYNCVTMGWCYTGTIAAAFQKIGAFKLKVYDKEVCKACTTVDCAKGCPIGLVDMPGHFRTKGQFTSTKCCGVGDCIEACPYGNMYIHDIRHVIGRAIGVDLSKKRPAKAPGAVHPTFGASQLPMYTGHGAAGAARASTPAPTRTTPADVGH